MDATESDSLPPAPPVKIIQPCSEACTCFQHLRTGGWSDFGYCTNPRSPHHGTTVRLGLECRYYQDARAATQPRQS